MRASEEGAAEPGGVILRGALGTLRAALLASLGFSLPSGCGGESRSNGTGPEEPALAPCTDSSDVGGGIERCAEGWTHRARVVTCESTVPRAGTIPAASLGDRCDSDSDCSHLTYGHCRPWRDGLPPAEHLECRAGCVSDADCGAGKLCLCGTPVGTCVEATCTTDADCDLGLCAASTVPGACQDNGTRFDCQHPDDACMITEDCLPDHFYCSMDGDRRGCTNAPTCGRPFLVAGVARQAELALSAARAWSAPVSPDVSELDSAQRLALAEHWSRMALMEHASIAAFARFVLELLSMAAPAELVREAQRAMQDEIEHAELCFGLASAYAGRQLAPGPLELEGALTGRSRRDIVVNAYREACLGETQATIEARAALEHAREPSVRAVLARIAEDEARHAELGYRFLQFALETAPLEERVALRAALRAELAASSEPPGAGGPGDGELAAHGLLSEGERAMARRSALWEVAVPCSRALFGAAALAVPPLRV
jgi:hypothetical protein